jgi:hypothetical protein
LCTGNGYITTTVLREILKELDDKLTAQDLDLMIEEIDSDGSGTVDFDGKIHEGRFLFLSPFQSYTIERNWWDTLLLLLFSNDKFLFLTTIIEKSY